MGDYVFDHFFAIWMALGFISGVYLFALGEQRKKTLADLINVVGLSIAFAPLAFFFLIASIVLAFWSWCERIVVWESK